jgi:hypothetical protein
MFCANCGHKQATDGIFCAKCGAKTGGVTTSATQQVQEILSRLTMNGRLSKRTLVVTLIAIVGIVGFFIVRDSTGLVGTWENNEGSYRKVYTFNRNGTGMFRDYYQNGELCCYYRFTWEVASDGWLIMLMEGIHTETLNFSVSRSTLVVGERGRSGEVYQRVRR